MESTVENITPPSLPASRSPSRSIGGKKTPHSKEVREKVHRLYVSGVPALEIEEQTGVPVNTTRKWAQRDNWTLNRDDSQKMTDGMVDSMMAGAIDRRSGEVRRLLAAEAVRLAQELAMNPKSSASTFKTVVEASDKLFGWSKPEGSRCLVQIGMLDDIAPTPTPHPEPASTESAVNV